MKPELLVCLGATAAQAIMGRGFRVTRDRGVVLESPVGRPVLATVHPSSILRAPDDVTRESEMQQFIADLRVAAETLREGRAAALLSR